MEKESVLVDYVFNCLENKENIDFNFACKPQIDQFISICKKRKVQKFLNFSAEQCFPDKNSVDIETIMLIGLTVITTPYTNEETFLRSKKDYNWQHLIIFLCFVHKVGLLHHTNKHRLKLAAIKTLNCFCAEWLTINMSTCSQINNKHFILLFWGFLLYTVYKYFNK